MKIFANHQIKDLDTYTIEHEPITSIDLMERAARKIYYAIIKRWNKLQPITVFAGPGNNGGDALAVARMLHKEGYTVTCYLFNPMNKLSVDCETNKEKLEKSGIANFSEVESQFKPPILTQDDVVIDGLFGSGLNKPLSGGFAAVVKLINASDATVVSIDVPSGLMGEDNSFNQTQHIIKADYTFCFEFPRLSFLFAENQTYLGEWEVLPINLHPDAINQTYTPYKITTLSDIQGKLKKRPLFSHKGTFGHALLIAGSKGMAGASILSAKACLRSGIGLLTIHAPICNLQILQTTVPEAITQIDAHESCFACPVETQKYNAIGIGPGLGESPESELAFLDLLEQVNIPLVLDADALNFIGRNKNSIKNIPYDTILTPHPKELDRIIGNCTNSYSRLSQATDLAQATRSYIVLKGAYTTIITPDGNCYFNPTGNPGMATGGSGDILTGIILALLAQGYSSFDASLIGTYVHGLAGDLAKENKGEIGMTAQDIVDYLPLAWKEIAQ